MERTAATVTNTPPLLPEASREDRHLYTSACLRLVSLTSGTLQSMVRKLIRTFIHSISTSCALPGYPLPYRGIICCSFCSLSKKDMQILNLCKVQEFIDKGRLVPKSDSFITIRDFLSSGLISRAKDGVKLLAQVRPACMVRICRHRRCNCRSSFLLL